MGKSMRVMAKAIEKRKAIKSESRECYREVVKLLREGKVGVREIARRCGIPKSTCYNIKMRIKGIDGQEMAFNAALPRSVCRPTVLSDEEEALIVERINFAGKRGFALSADALKAIMAKVASDGRPGWQHNLPSDDAVRLFRARHRDITYRNSENKDNAKLKGENYEHVLSYVKALREVEGQHSGIFQDGNRLWNMDETNVDAEFGRRVKVLGSSSTHHGGFISSTTGSGSGKHVTCVVAVSASGLKAPPFFIVAGKNRMSNWFEPLDGDAYQYATGNIHPLAENNWCPDDACVVMTENGSMDMNTIPIFIKHLNLFVRKTLPLSLHYVLCLDGHSSRKGIEWLELCVEYKCEVVQSPANTSHSLQPCDNAVNKKFHRTVRSIRDEICSLALTDTRSVKVKLMLGIKAVEAVTTQEIQKSIQETGLLPMRFDFSERCKTAVDKIKEEQAQAKQRMNQSSVSGRLSAVRKRQSDKETSQLALTIFSSSDGPSRKIQKLSMLIQRQNTVNSILMDAAGPRSGNSSRRSSNASAVKNISLPSGAPGEYLTMKDTMDRRRSAIQSEKDAAVAKAEQHEERQAARVKKAAERERNRVEREQVKARRAAEKQARAVDIARRKRVRAEETAAKALQTLAAGRPVPSAAPNPSPS